MLKIITLNVNGIRAAARKGFFKWLCQQNADVVCLQEIKAQEADLLPLNICPEGYQSYYHYAGKKGYSGCAIYSRIKPTQVITGLGFPHADDEGRFVAINLNNKLWVASFYMPSGTSGEERQTIKNAFLIQYAEYLNQLLASGSEYIICGDWNIAHKQIDLKNWRGNQKNSGFLPHERAWMDTLFDTMGFVDAFRLVNQEADQYTWWSNRGRAYEKNVGWRIDYQITTPSLKNAVKSASIYKDERFSDHAPLIMEYDIILD